MLDHLHYLELPQPRISKERFAAWKNDPITLALKKALVTSILKQLDDPFPDSVEQTALQAHRREGAMFLFEELMNWSPELIDPEAADDDA